MAMAIDPPQSSSSSPTDSELLDGTVLKDGFLRKLKTGRKKYFVLKSANIVGPAKLEYYDSYKKWSSRQRPKRTIFLEDAFKICRRADVKNKLAIGLYMRDSTFSVVCKDDESLHDWLGHLISAKYYHHAEDSDIEDVWDVNVKCKLKDEGYYQNYRLRGERTIQGSYRLILKSEGIVLCKMSKAKEQWDLTVTSIRGCASSQETFFVEMGRSFPLGPCELVMLTADAAIAEGIHKKVANFMKEWRKDLDVRHRERQTIVVKRRNSSSLSTKVTVNASGFGSYKNPIRVRADTLPATSTVSAHLVTTSKSVSGLDVAAAKASTLDGGNLAFGPSSADTAPAYENVGRRRHRSASRHSRGYSRACSSMSCKTSPSRANSPFNPSSGHCSDYGSGVMSIMEWDQQGNEASSRRPSLVSAATHVFTATATVPTASAVLTSMAGSSNHCCCHHVLPHLLSNHPEGAVVSTQPPIIEENSENGSGEQYAVRPIELRVAVTRANDGDEEYVPFDPDTELLRRLTRTMLTPTTPTAGQQCSCGRGGMVSQVIPQQEQRQASSSEEELLIWPSQRLSLASVSTPTGGPTATAIISTAPADLEYLEMSPYPIGTNKGARQRTLTASTNRSRTTTTSSGASSAGSAACINDEYIPMDRPMTADERFPLMSRRFSATAADDGRYLDMSMSTRASRSRSTSARRYSGGSLASTQMSNLLPARSMRSSDLSSR